MKKVIFSAAAFGMVAVSGMALAPTSAEAIPAFARQTGAACLSCHFQTFPALKAFGRAFKRNSFTDVGDEALVEDDNLSIPAVLNATVVIRGNYTNTKKTNKASSGAWNVPLETPLLVAGRLGTNTGAFVEFGNSGAGAGSAFAAKGPNGNTSSANGASGAMGVGNWQLLNSWDVGDFKVGLGAHNSGFGGSAVFETSNVFGQHGGKLAGSDVSAIQAAGFGNATLGVGAWVGNEMGDVQFALVAPSGAQGTNVGFHLAKLVRAHLFLDAGGWDTMIGFGVVTGSAGKAQTKVGGQVTNYATGKFNMDLQFVDFQAQGEVGDMSVGFYADYAQSKAKILSGGSTLGGNPYQFYGGLNNNSGDKFTGYSARVEVKPIDRVLFGIGYGYNKVSVANAANLTATYGGKNTIFHLAATYEVYQNFELNLVYNNTKFSPTKAGATSTTTKETIFEFEGLL